LIVQPSPVRGYQGVCRWPNVPFVLMCDGGADRQLIENPPGDRIWQMWEWEGKLPE
jgi:hypothetical protein